MGFFLLALDFGTGLGALPEPGVLFLDGFAVDFGAALKVLMWEDVCVRLEGMGNTWEYILNG